MTVIGAEDGLDHLVAALHGGGRLRVWSLVITVFGDAIQPRGGQVSSARLQRLFEMLRVEPGAVRTALSRLTRDGWLERDRDGRGSLYRLSASGREAFAPATELIYAAPRRGPVEEWVLATGVDGARLRGIALGGAVWLWPGDRPLPDLAGAEVLMHGPLPRIAPALRLSIPGAEHRDAMAAFLQLLAALDTCPQSPERAIAARILLVHAWCRIVLRFPDLPRELAPADWQGTGCRALVAARYRALLPASEAWLDAPVDSGAGLPAPGPRFAARFGLDSTA